MCRKSCLLTHFFFIRVFFSHSAIENYLNSGSEVISLDRQSELSAFCNRWWIRQPTRCFALLLTLNNLYFLENPNLEDLSLK